jgi:hypothetical protein
LKRNQSGDRRLKKKNRPLKQTMMSDESTSSSSRSPVRVPQTISFPNTPQFVFDEQLHSILIEVLEHTADEDFIEKHELVEDLPCMALSGEKQLLIDSEHAFNVSKSSLLDSFQSCEESFDCNFFSVSELLEPRPIEEMMHDRPFCTEQVYTVW